MKITFGDKVARILVQCFINKIEDDKTRRDFKIDKNSFQVFTDPTVRKQRKFGWYAWMNYLDEDKTEICSAIDIEMSKLEKGLSDTDVLSLILNHYIAYVEYGIHPFTKEEFELALNDVSDD